MSQKVRTTTERRGEEAEKRGGKGEQGWVGAEGKSGHYFIRSEMISQRDNRVKETEAEGGRGEEQNTNLAVQPKPCFIFHFAA